jgi:serine/threonine protein kinase
LGRSPHLAASQAEAVSSDWKRITALFGAARLLEGVTRTAFLETACGDDEGLRREVDRLLADSTRQDSFLMDPAWSAASFFAIPPVSPGDILKDRYRIDETVASGGQAIVYRATDTVLSRPVIVKVPRGDVRHTRLLKCRFEREMQALSQIDHPGVVGIFDIGELADGRPFLVIQYVSGVSLREELNKGAFAPERAARLLRQLASALRAAHAAGVAHRDLKPENILLQRAAGEEETLKLIDFGISNIIGEPAVSTVVAGTIRYMAPEQFQGEGTPASDTYALAIVVCEMLCGHPDSRALPNSVGRKAKRLIDAALSFRPGDRPRDLGRWSDDLARAFITGHRVPTGRRWWMGVAAAAIALIIGRVQPATTLWRLAATVPMPNWTSRGHESRASPPTSATVREAAVTDLTGEWEVTDLLTVCGFLCGSPLGTVYHEIATFSQDTVTTFHGTFFGRPVSGTVSGASVSFAWDNVSSPARNGWDKVSSPTLTFRGNCVGTIAGSTMTLNCSSYIKPNAGSEFLLNGQGVDTLVKQLRE